MRSVALDKARSDPDGTAARILDSAEEVFAACGYGAASTREMARQADVPFGAVHYHWGSKQELWQAVISRISERTQATVMQNLVPGATPGETLDNIVDAFLNLLIANPNTARLSHRMVLEGRDLGVPSVQAMVRDLGDFGMAVVRRQLPALAADAPAALLIVSNAVLGAVLDVDGQRALLGGPIATSTPARARLRAELKRVMRAIFRISRSDDDRAAPPARVPRTRPVRRRPRRRS